MDVSTAQMRTSAKDMRITGVKTLDIRFPTSRSLDGSDAMNADPDYSAAYVILQTDSADLGGARSIRSYTVSGWAVGELIVVRRRSYVRVDEARGT